MDQEQINQLLDGMADGAEAVLKHDRIFKVAANSLTRSIDELVNAGCSREEAVQIVATQGPIIKALNQG